MGIVDELQRAREAYDRREWASAYERLSAVDDLTTGDLLALATAAHLIGDTDACIRALQRGYQAEVRNEDPLRAVRFAFWLGLVLSLRGEHAVAGGWVARAQRLLSEHPDDVVERGYLLIHEFFRCLGQHDFDGASTAAAEVTETGRRFADPDLLSQGLMSQGRLLIYAGRVPEGLALLDESMVGIAASEVSPVFAGMIYCSMIEACQEVSDLARASAWTSALTRWCDTQPDLVPFTGQCAVHRGQILRQHGAFQQALDEFDLARLRYTRMGEPAAAGLALSERGDVLRIRGEYAEAELCYEQASGQGHEPQPGLALLWLDRGRTPAAVAAVRRLLAETHDPVHRCRVLPAAVEILATGEQVDDARPLVTELTGIAASFGCPALRAMAAYCSGLVALLAGDADGALPDVKLARQLWTGLGAPYEAARARVLVGRAYRALGDERSATAELTAACTAFGELGATPRRHEAEKLLRQDVRGGLTLREVEILRLVAAGNSNDQIARLLVLSDKTVARHLTNIFTKLDVPSRTAAAAYAHEHDLL